MRFAKIKGTGGYVPKRVVTNAELEKMVDTTDEWIVERTGIRQRHIMADEETTSTMAHQAAMQALDAAGMKASELDLIIVGTCTPDKTFPSAACILQSHLDVPGIPAFDINAACSGFMYGMSIADQYIRSGMMKNVLVVGAESLSRIVDWEDRRTCILFSDGAGACVLSGSDEPGIYSTHIYADGSHKDLLSCPNHIGKTDEQKTIQMSGNEVFKLAVTKLGEVVEVTLKHNNLDKADIDWLVPHQANMRIIKATAKKLSMPMERVVLTIDRHGNTSAASVPLAFNEAVRDGRIKPDQLVLMEAFGGGMSWGSVLVRM